MRKPVVSLEAAKARRPAIAAAAVVLALVGYVSADLAGSLPGPLSLATSSSAASPSASPSGPPLAALPAAAPTPSLPTPGAGTGPTASGITSALGGQLKASALGPRVGVSIIDGLTGDVITSSGSSKPMTVASTQKLLTALAVIKTYGLDERMRTTALYDSLTNTLILRAGGDTLLATGAGDESRVIGRAGLKDLAEATAASLSALNAKPASLRLDLTYAPGPAHPASWPSADIYSGSGGQVAMIGLGTDRSSTGSPGPKDPVGRAAQAFRAALVKEGVSIPLSAPSTWSAPTPSTAAEVAEVASATYAEVLDLALDESDNTLTENLARQAAARRGVAAAAVPSFIVDQLADAGVPTSGIKLKDASGLSPGQLVPPVAIATVLSLATGDTVPGLRETIQALPVGGVNGTLEYRYQGADTAAARGVVRAKTGTLTGVSSLAGFTTDRTGYPLMFVLAADRVPRSSGTEAARAALDEIVATLTGCGCR